MKILMLGHSGVGKTTFMGAMYGVLQHPVSEFSVRAADDADHGRLMRVYEKILLGQYPAPTDSRDRYELRLRHQEMDVLAFDWIDYRGKALVERSTESPEARAFHADLQSADAVLVFFDSTVLARGGGYFPEVRRMIVLLSKAVEAVDHRLPLGLVMAKSDLVASNDAAPAAEELKGLVETIRASTHVIASILPVAVRGRRLDNVDVPALFALHYGLRERVRSLGEQVVAMAAERDRMRGYVSSFWDFAADWIGSRWNSTSTWGELADRKHRELMKEYDAMQDLAKRADLLADYLGDTRDVRVFGGALAKGAGE